MLSFDILSTRLSTYAVRIFCLFSFSSLFLSSFFLYLPCAFFPFLCFPHCQSQHYCCSFFFSFFLLRSLSGSWTFVFLGQFFLFCSNCSVFFLLRIGKIFVLFEWTILIICKRSRKPSKSKDYTSALTKCRRKRSFKQIMYQNERDWVKQARQTRQKKKLSKVDHCDE